MEATSIALFLLLVVILLILIWWFSDNAANTETSDISGQMSILSHMNGDKIDSCIMCTYVDNEKKYILIDKSLRKVSQLEENNNVSLLIIGTTGNPTKLSWSQMRFQGNLEKRGEIDNIAIFELVNISVKNTTTEVSKTGITEHALLDGNVIRSGVALFGTIHFRKAVEYIQSL